MKQWLTGLFLMCSFCALSQQWQRKHWGVQAQFTANIGTHKTTIGFKLNSYLAFDYVQLNVGTAYRYNAFNLGQRGCFSEWRHTTGLVLMAGKETNPINFNWDGALHQTKRPYSIGYAYLWYFDPLGTSQRSGTWNIGIKRVDIQFENDVFGGQAKDRFRTGNLHVSYRDRLRSLGVGLMICFCIDFVFVVATRELLLQIRNHILPFDFFIVTLRPVVTFFISCQTVPNMFL